MLLRDILPVLDTIAPLRFAEPWDNVGLIAGDPAAPVSRILLTIDYTSAVAEEAHREKCELVVAYHPPLFEAIKRIHASSLVYRAIRDGVALYSPHTALDVAPGGTNDVLADILGMVERAPLKLSPGKNAHAKPVASAPESDEGTGIGRVGTLGAPVERATLIEQIKRGLGVESLLVAGPVEGAITRAAVCAGAGSSLLEDALGKGAELYLTGEIRHHDALRAASLGMTVVCALHSNSERVALGRVKERIEREVSGVLVRRSTEDRDPFTVR